jgi:exonuclease III
MIYQWNTNFSVWSLNVNQKVNFGNLHDRLRADLPDLVFLQECIESSDSLNHTFNRFGYKAFSSICEERGHGVAVLYRDTLPILDILPLEPGALLLVNLEDISLTSMLLPAMLSKLKGESSLVRPC